MRNAESGFFIDNGNVQVTLPFMRLEVFGEIPVSAGMTGEKAGMTRIKAGRTRRFPPPRE